MARVLSILIMLCLVIAGCAVSPGQQALPQDLAILQSWSGDYPVADTHLRNRAGEGRLWPGHPVPQVHRRTAAGQGGRGCHHHCRDAVTV